MREPRKLSNVIANEDSPCAVCHGLQCPTTLGPEPPRW